MFCQPQTLARDAVSRLPSVEVTVYPYECDAYGHLNEAAYLTIFERARWEALARGPGADLFARHAVWPAVRKATIEFRAPAFPGDMLSVDLHLERLGRTSVELRQSAKRVADGVLLAEAHLVFVMLDGKGRPVAIPEEVAAVLGGRVSTLPGEMVRYDVGRVTLAADVRGDGPALLLVHGFPLDRSIWAHQVATLAGWRRIAPDLRGLGATVAPDDDYSIAAYADDLVGLLDRLRVSRAVVAGLSMGGYIAFEMMRRYRDRVAGLILCDTRADADSAEGRAARDAMMALANEQGVGVVAERLLPRVLGRTTQLTQPHVVEQVREMMNRTSVAGMVGALRAMRERPDSTPLLPAIDVPTLVVVGQEDEMTPAVVAKAMTDAIPSAAMTIIAGAGHLSPLEAPSAVSRVLAEFLEHVRDSVE
jgi:YbgC/YbaW family acyl-CoA thioester hydrolase